MTEKNAGCKRKEPHQKNTRKTAHTRREHKKTNRRGTIAARLSLPQRETQENNIIISVELAISDLLI